MFGITKPPFESVVRALVGDPTPTSAPPVGFCVCASTTTPTTVPYVCTPIAFGLTQPVSDTPSKPATSRATAGNLLMRALSRRRRGLPLAKVEEGHESLRSRRHFSRRGGGCGDRVRPFPWSARPPQAKPPEVRG